MRNIIKPVFGGSENVRFKPACSAAETSLKIEISLAVGLEMILFNKGITKALIRLRGCAGWSAPLLFANPPRQVFSRRGPNEGGFQAILIILLKKVLVLKRNVSTRQIFFNL